MDPAFAMYYAVITEERTVMIRWESYREIESLFNNEKVSTYSTAAAAVIITQFSSEMHIASSLEEVADCEGQFQGECWILQAQQYSTIFSTCSIGL